MPVEKLDSRLLHELIVRIGNHGSGDPRQLGTTQFLDLLDTNDGRDLGQKKVYLNFHLDYLEKDGWLLIKHRSTRQDYRTIELTGLGRKYIQPELVDFGRSPMLPEIVQALESQILTYPDEESPRLIHTLRESVAKGSVTLFKDILVEIGAKAAAKIIIGPSA